MIECKISVVLTLATLVFMPVAAADRVTISSGVLQGTVSDLDPEVRLYAGVPFAAPPVGKLRWQPPQPATSWEGVRNADKWAARCMQGPVYGELNSRDTAMSEDCLYLNVWVPAEPGTEKLPVYLWFYGGGFAAGSAAEHRYDGTYIASQGIVVVEPNYRLGPPGFFAHPELTAESPHKASGNYGLMDQVAALRWVRENIAAFGGDPDNITIGGESAGSLSVSALMASPLSRDQFHKSIGQSGAYFDAPASDFTLESLADAERSGVRFAESFDVASIDELRAVPAEELVAATMKTNPLLFGPIVDGYVLPASVAAIFGEGQQSRVPLLAGWNEAELGMAIFFNPNKPTVASFAADMRKQFGEHTDAALSVYPATTDEQAIESAVAIASDVFMAYPTWKWVEEQVRANVPVYRYRFDRIGPDPSGANRYGAVHAVEIEYAFNVLNRSRTDWEPADRKVARTMADYWANFIKTGDPNGEGLAEWPEFGANGQVMYLDADSAAGPEEHRVRHEFLDEIAEH